MKWHQWICWTIQLTLARLGFYRYEGIETRYEGPRGVVLYKEGSRTYPLPLGNAVDYAEMWDGVVIPPTDYKP